MLTLCLISIAPSAKAEATGYVWTEHFDYDTNENMTAAGWHLGVPSQTFHNSSSVTLSGVGQDNPISYSDFPSGIADWKAESRSRWVGGGGGTASVGVNTDTNSYGWWIDGYYHQYIFSIGSNKVIQIPGPVLTLNQWEVMTMIKTGDNISLYHNSVYITSYLINGSIGTVRSMSLVAPWQGIAEYDYLQFEGAPYLLWQRTYGGSSSDTGFNLVPTSDGGMAILGVTRSFGQSVFDAYLIRTDSNGAELWHRTYGTSSYEWAYSLTATADGGFLIGGTTYPSGFRAWLVKVDSNGNQQWTRTYGDVPTVGFAAIQTTDGGYALTGYKSVTGNGYDAYLLKTDAQGNEQWERTWGGTGNDWGKSLLQTSDGGYLETGWTDSSGAQLGFMLKYNSSGALEFNRTLGAPSTVVGCTRQLANGDYLIGGQTSASGNGLNDFLLIRTDSSGSIIWQKTYGGTGWDNGTTIIVLDDGYVLSGDTTSFNYTTNIYTATKILFIRTDLNGTEQYAGVYGPGNVPVYGYVAARLSDGSFAGVGHTNNYSSGLDDVYAFRLGTMPAPVASSPTIIQNAAESVGAVAVGSGVALLGVFVAARAAEGVTAASSTASTGLGAAKGHLVRRLHLEKIYDFIYGYGKGRVHSYFWKQVAKVEPEDEVAVRRQPLFATLSALEIGVIFFTSVFLGAAFMITNKIDLSNLSLWLVYILVAGVAVILHDLAHRYVAWRYGVTTEYKFWFLGTIIMFITAIFFHVVYSSPSRLAINDPEKLTVKQQAIVYGSGPVVSLIVFVAFLALVPFGGFAATVGLLGATMNLLTAVYALMPLEPMDGRKIYKWNKGIWLVLFVPMLALYFALTIFML